MKHEKQNERLACDQQAQGIENIHVVNVKINNRANTSPEIFVTQLPSYAVNLGSKGGDNTISGHHIGKAPPDQTCGHPPAKKADPIRPNHSKTGKLSHSLQRAELPNIISN